MKKEKIIITTLLVVFTATLLIQLALLNVLATKYLLLIIVFICLIRCVFNTFKQENNWKGINNSNNTFIFIW